MYHLRKELSLNHSLLQYMLVVGLVSPLEAMYWFAELVRSCSLITMAYWSINLSSKYWLLLVPEIINLFNKIIWFYQLG